MPLFKNCQATEPLIDTCFMLAYEVALILSNHPEKPEP